MTDKYCTATIKAGVVSIECDQIQGAKPQSPRRDRDERDRLKAWGQGWRNHAEECERELATYRAALKTIASAKCPDKQRCEANNRAECMEAIAREALTDSGR